MNVVELCNVTKTFGDIIALRNVSFSVAKSSTVSLLGPSGCGKTTTLRLIAGFEEPDEGTVLIAGKDMGGKRPYERNVGLLFQDYALFPHMSVADNIAYGMRYRGFERRKRADRTEEMLALVKLVGYGGRRPHQLSGGEQQRVALARALAVNPELLLLDEPLSALDAKLRHELRAELKDILSHVGVTAIVVTHDQEEAFGIAERVIVMNRGAIAQDGNPRDVYLRPANRFVAEFVGRSNWFEGKMCSENDDGTCLFVAGSGIRLRVPRPAKYLLPPHLLCVRPERIVVRESLGDKSDGEARKFANVLQGVVHSATPLGADMHLLVDLTSGSRIAVIEKNLGQRLRRAGEAVSLCFNPEDCIVVAE